MNYFLFIYYRYEESDKMDKISDKTWVKISVRIKYLK